MRPAGFEPALRLDRNQDRKPGAYAVFRHGRVVETWWGVLATFATSLFSRRGGGPRAAPPPRLVYLIAHLR